jgi:hypothetical protein
MIKLNPIYYTNGDGLYVSKQEGMREFRNDLSGFSNITFEGKGGNESFAFNVEGIRFNVSKEEMISVFQTCTIIKGVIQERCVIGKVSSANCIIPVDSKRYLEIVEDDTAFRYNNYKVKDLQPGDLVKVIDEEDTFNFLGDIYGVKVELIEEKHLKPINSYAKSHDVWKEVKGLKFNLTKLNYSMIKVDAHLDDYHWRDMRFLNPKSKNNKIKFVQKGGLLNSLTQDLNNVPLYLTSHSYEDYKYPSYISLDTKTLKIKLEKKDEKLRYSNRKWVDCSEELLIQEVNIDEEIKFDKIVKNYYDLIGQFSLKIIFYV